MDHQNIQNQDLSLVLTNEVKPRLKWTPELHRRFIRAVAQLGGLEKATPKGLMRVMGIRGLTLYHLKSHLQKYRQGKSQSQSQHSFQEDFSDTLGCDLPTDSNAEDPNKTEESLKIAQALEMQRKLEEQIEVQRHLQLRIEAQGKYLHSVLRKAQDTLSLSGYNFSAFGVEIAKTELSELGCPSCSFSALTEVESPGSLTSFDSLERKESCVRSGRKRSGSVVSDCSTQVKKKRQKFDLNREYVDDFDESKSKSNPNTLDLKFK